MRSVQGVSVKPEATESALRKYPPKTPDFLEGKWTSVKRACWVYLTDAFKFTNQIIQSIKNNAVNDFVNFYQLIDVLIVDDIQFL